METLHVGPTSPFRSIAAAMLAAVDSDTIQLDSGYSNETATVTHTGMIFAGDATSTGIVLQLGAGIAAVTTLGLAPFEIRGAIDGNGVTGTVTISGTPEVGQTLTASNSLASANGLGPISYHWEADGTDISGALGSSFVVTAAQIGKAIDAVATYTDQLGIFKEFDSPKTSLVTAGRTPPADWPRIYNDHNFSTAAGTNAALAGVRLTDDTADRVLTVAVSDSTGLLHTSATSNVLEQGQGTTSLILVGRVDAINTELATLTYQACAVASTDWLWLSVDTGVTPQVGDHVVVTVTPTPGTVPPIVIPPVPISMAVYAPQTLSLAVGEIKALGGVSLTEIPTDDRVSVNVSDTTGLLQTSATTGVATQGEGTTSLMLTGTAAAIDTALASLTYQAGTVAGTDWLWVSANAPDTPQVASHVVVTVTAAPGTVVTPPVVPLLGVTVPKGLGIAAGDVAPLVGVTLSDSQPDSDVTVTVSDGTGLLYANAISGVTIQGENSTTLNLTGHLAAVNVALSALTYHAGSAAGADWVWVSANAANSAGAIGSLVATVTPAPGTEPPVVIPPVVPLLQVTVPAGFSITAGGVSALTGITVGDSQPDGEVTATVSDGFGLLHTTPTRGVTITGENSNTLNLTGHLAAVNAALSALTYQAGAATGADWVWVSANAANSAGAIGSLVATVTALAIDLGEIDNTLVLDGADYVMIGGDGNNTLTFGNGNDTVTLGNGNNTLTLGNGRDRVTLGNGNNTLTLGTGHDQVTLGSGNNTLTLGGGIVSVSAPAASLGAITMTGNGGSTTLILRGGGTAIMGATISGITAVQLLTPAAGEPANMFTANSQAGLTITSSEGEDTITVGAASQTVTTGPDEVLVRATAANAGAAILPGTGTTSLEVTTGGTITLNPLDTHLTVQLDAPSMLNLSGLGFITAIGSAGADTIVAGGTNQTLTGGGGDDTLVGYAGFGTTFGDTASNLNGSTIKNFGGNDAIDFNDMLPGSAVLGFAAGLLTVSGGGSTSAIALPGDFTAANFHLGADLHGGTMVTYSSA